MRVYLVGRQGGRTAFCITNSQVLTSLDHIIEESIEYNMGSEWRLEYGFNSCLHYNSSRYNIYYNDLDGEDYSKKVTDNVYTKIVEQFLKDNPERLKEYKKRYKFGIQKFKITN